MQKLTPWFDAKLHVPVRDGLYDCKQCGARHLFRDGHWYRDKNSVRSGPMYITKMDWRGLSAAAIPSREQVDGPLTAKQIKALRKGVSKRLSRGKRLSGALLAQYDPSVPRSQEELDWDNMVPVGREFGSPDYERLMEEDARTIQVNLTRLVSKCKGLYDADENLLQDKKMRKDAINVQAVLRELGFDVSVEDAAAVWVRHSNSLCAGWMAGAEKVKHAKWALISFAQRGTDDFMRGAEDSPAQKRFLADIRQGRKEAAQGKIAAYQFGKPKGKAPK